MQILTSGRVRFGASELDLSTGELRSTDRPEAGKKVLLREQVFRVLRMLLEQEGQIVTREEIKDRLWPEDTVVDFDATNELLDLRGYGAAGVTDFTSLMTHAAQLGDDTIITFDANNAITLQDIQLNQLSHSDFLFS